MCHCNVAEIQANKMTTWKLLKLPHECRLWRWRWRWTAKKEKRNNMAHNLVKLSHTKLSRRVLLNVMHNTLSYPHWMAIMLFSFDMCFFKLEYSLEKFYNFVSFSVCANAANAFCLMGRACAHSFYHHSFKRFGGIRWRHLRESRLSCSSISMGQCQRQMKLKWLRL